MNKATLSRGATFALGSRFRTSGLHARDHLEATAAAAPPVAFWRQPPRLSPGSFPVFCYVSTFRGCGRDGCASRPVVHAPHASLSCSLPCVEHPPHIPACARNVGAALSLLVSSWRVLIVLLRCFPAPSIRPARQPAPSSRRESRATHLCPHKPEIMLSHDAVASAARGASSTRPAITSSPSPNVPAPAREVSKSHHSDDFCGRRERCAPGGPTVGGIGAKSWLHR